jgi:hypothetical protein
LEIFIKYKIEVENQKDTRIKRLRVRRGGEYESDPFNEFCELNGIIYEVTPPYSPEYNGVAERKNRTLMRCLLVQGYPPRCRGKPSLWLVTYRIRYLIRKLVKHLMNFGKGVSLTWNSSKCGGVWLGYVT